MEKTQVLDHGYIELVGSWGSDEEVIEAARMSTDKGFLGWGGARQCRYCGEERPMLTDCAASGAGHEFGLYGPPGDERRYTPMPNLNYVPIVARMLMGGGANKQAQSTGAVLIEAEASFCQGVFQGGYEVAEELYQKLLLRGVTKELARLIVPVGRYSRMRASANLRNVLRSILFALCIYFTPYGAIAWMWWRVEVLTDKVKRQSDGA